MSDPGPSPDSTHHPSRRATGPTTPAGKQKSSRNALIHGCCSKTLILPGESQEAFDQLLDDWLADYQPRNSHDRLMVETAAREQWLALRNANHYVDLQHSLSKKNPLEWTEEDHKKLERSLRYKTTAERSFQRAFHNLEQVRKRRAREEQEAALSEEQQPALSEEEASSAASAEPLEEEPQPAMQISEHKKPFIHGLEQWVDITIGEDGRAITTLEPSTEQLLEDLRVMKPAPELVRRRFYFHDGIPDEYSWCLDPTGDLEHQRAARRQGMQRMTIETWLEAIHREQAAATGHLSDTGPDLPPPNQMSQTPCWCLICQRNYNICDRRKP